MSNSIDKQKVSPRTYPLLCNMCEKELPSKESLEVHMKIHSEQQHLPCQVQDCGQNFPVHKLLWSHMLSVHGVRREAGVRTWVKCDQCGYVATKGQVNRHMEKHSNEKKFGCQECGKLFKGSDGLKYHIKRHQGIYDFPCIECDKKFVCSASLKTHMLLVHTVEKNYTCQTCGKKFKMKHQYTGHMTLHTGEKRLVCREGCDKRFRIISTRKQHERLHRGVIRVSVQ